MRKLKLVKESKNYEQVLIKCYLKAMITVLSCALGSLLRCICCRDGGLGWASEVRRVLSCGASVPGVSGKSPMLPNGIDLWPAGWAGEVFPGPFWLEVGEVEGFCS